MSMKYEDILNIWAYIANDSKEAAHEFVHKLDSNIFSLAVFPERNPFIPESTLLQTELYRHLIYRNYRIIYRIEQKTVIILRVFHGAKLLDISEFDR